MELHLNIKEVLISLLFFCLFLVQTACQKETVLEIGKLTLEQDTTWQGTVLITGDIYVPPGVTLTIQPATTVKFKRFDETSDILEASFLVEFDNLSQLKDAKKKLRELDKALQITFLDNKGLI